jgi:hypothetical protein
MLKVLASLAVWPSVDVDALGGDPLRRFRALRQGGDGSERLDDVRPHAAAKHHGAADVLEGEPGDFDAAEPAKQAC